MESLQLGTVVEIELVILVETDQRNGVECAGFTIDCSIVGQVRNQGVASIATKGQILGSNTTAADIKLAEDFESLKGAKHNLNWHCFDRSTIKVVKILTKPDFERVNR